MATISESTKRELSTSFVIENILTKLNLLNYPKSVYCYYNKRLLSYDVEFELEYSNKTMMRLFDEYYDKEYLQNYKNIIDEITEDKIKFIFSKLMSYLIDVINFKILEANLNNDINYSIKYHHSTLYETFLYEYSTGLPF